jgi:histidyl-tRNA synthetase
MKESSNIPIGPLSGFAEYREPEAVLFSQWSQRVLGIYQLHGFANIVPRPLESRVVLAAKGGIQHQVFGVSRLPNDAPTDMALPFDRTVPFARWVAAHAGTLVFPVRRADVGFSFRGERAQAGRYQGFIQADIDIVAPTLAPLDDAECVATIAHALGVLDVGAVTMRLSHLGLVRALLGHFGVSREHNDRALRALDSVGDAGREAVSAALVEATCVPRRDLEPLIKLTQQEGDLAALKACLPDSPAVWEAFEEFEQVITSAVELGVSRHSLRVSLRIARGLDYYTGTVFETHLHGGEQFGSVASGGRFDNLVEAFGGRSLPGVGGSIGLTRLFDIALRTGRVQPGLRTPALVVVGARTPAELPEARAVASALRKYNIATELASATGARTLLTYGNKKGHRVAVVAMSRDSIVVRVLASGNQVDVDSIAAAVEAARQHTEEH